MAEEVPAVSRIHPLLRLAGALIAISLIILLGYFTFVLFVVSFAPNAGAFSLIIFAAVAGVATFFNPCAFPLMPGYLAHQVKVTPGEERRSLGSLLYGGSIAAMGLSTFNLLLGGILAFLGATFLGSLALASAEPNLAVRIFRGVVGILLIALGVSHVTGRGLSFGFLEGIGQRFRFFKGTRSTKELYAYGFGYNAVGIGCGGPILAGLSVFAFAFGGFGATLVAFLVFSLTMASLMIAISLLPTILGAAPMRRLGRSTGKIQRISGIVQTIVGIFILFSSIYTALFVGVFFPS